MAAGGSFYPIHSENTDVPSLSLELNNKCPLSCPKCFLLRNNAISNEPLPDACWLDVLRIAAQTSPGLKTIYVHGQEVSMVPELLADVILEFRRLQSQGYFKSTEIGFITSGIGAKNIVDALDARSVFPDHCAVSIDGFDADSNAIYRESKNAFEQARQGAALLADYVGSDRLSIATIVGPDNLSSLPKMYEFIKDNGWKSVVVSTLVETDNNGVFTPALSGRDFRREFDELAQHLSKTNDNSVVVQGLTLDSDEWAREAVGSIPKGGQIYLYGDQTFGVNIRRSVSIDQITRIRFDGLVLVGNEILDTKIESDKFIHSDDYQPLINALQDSEKHTAVPSAA